MRISIAIAIVSLFGLLAAPAAADSVTYTDQNVKFDLDVVTGGGMVTATLKVTSILQDSPIDFMKTVSIKIFSSYIAPTFPTAPAGSTWTAVAGARIGNSNGGQGQIQNSGANSGFASADANNVGPSLATGNMHTWVFKFTTNAALLSDWSIKAWSADSPNPGTKSRQWSSGGLTPTASNPGPGPGPGQQIPEPATALLLCVAAAGLGLRRARG